MKIYILKPLFTIGALLAMGLAESNCTAANLEDGKKKGDNTSTDKANESVLWQKFVAAQKTGEPTLLLDFSYAGYRHAETGVPMVTHKVFNVVDFGAVADDGKSDREPFEKAIAAAVANGSGIIYFPKGRFILRDADSPNTPIVIPAGNIVLRGEGSQTGGTELFMEVSNPPKNPSQMWSSPEMVTFKVVGGSKAKITDVTADAQRGSYNVEVASTAALKVGDWVCLALQNNSPELIAKELAPYSVDTKWTDLTVNGVAVHDYHMITAISGNKVTFKEPIMHGVESKYGWFIRKFPRIEEVGVENLAFVGNWKKAFIHHRDWEHDGGYKPLTFNGVINSWIRDVRFTDISEALSVISSANVSVYDCRITGNMGHSAMRAQGSSRVFFGKVVDEPSQWHSLGISKPSIGNVLWRITTRSNSCFESHASQPRATLFDCCEGGFMRGRAGGAENNNPNHMGDLFFWNYKATDAAKKDFDFWATDTPYWRFVMPAFIGFHGNATTFVQSQVATDESHGQPVDPESLYEAQLKLRLGKLPQWLEQLKTR